MPRHTRGCLTVDYCARTGYYLMHDVNADDPSKGPYYEKLARFAAGAAGGSEVGNLYNDPLAATYAFVRRRVTSGRRTFDRRRHTFQVGFAEIGRAHV